MGNRKIETVKYNTTQTVQLYKYTAQNKIDTIKSYNTQYVSNLTPAPSPAPTNGLGPIEKDRSNGESGANDGNTIKLNSVEYEKGLGVYANSEVTYNLGGNYKYFMADIGMDDNSETADSQVKFQVYADGTLIYDSGTMKRDTATKSIVLDVSQKNTLKLKVDSDGSTTADYADWADAKLVGTETGTLTYTYDANGNLTNETRNGYTYEHTYNQLNQLESTTVKQGGTTISTTTNTYNGEGYRVKQIITKGGTTTTRRYIYEYDKVVMELDGTGAQVARNIYGINLLKRIAGSQSYYYMYNGHADVTALINTSNGNADATYSYDSWGTIISQTGTANNSITYAGYQYDAETKLYYLNARYYDSLTARFLQEDTYTGDINDSLSLNLYTYCHNKPLMYTDPDGHYSIPCYEKWSCCYKRFSRQRNNKRQFH